MENAEAKSPAKVDPVKKKRSGTERLIVWGGILLLIAVVVMEWQSREKYDESYKALETVLSDRTSGEKLKGIPVDQVDQYIKGFAFKSDGVEEKKTDPIRGEPMIIKTRRLAYTWPSLFKHYEFRLTVNGKDDHVIHIDPVIPGVN